MKQISFFACLAQARSALKSLGKIASHEECVLVSELKAPSLKSSFSRRLETAIPFVKRPKWKRVPEA